VLRVRSCNQSKISPPPSLPHARCQVRFGNPDGGRVVSPGRVDASQHPLFTAVAQQKELLS